MLKQFGSASGARILWIAQDLGTISSRPRFDHRSGHAVRSQTAKFQASDTSPCGGIARAPSHEVSKLPVVHAEGERPGQPAWRFALGLGHHSASSAQLPEPLRVDCIVPATMEQHGERNWYLPRWLGWLPHICMQGAPEGIVYALSAAVIPAALSADTRSA